MQVVYDANASTTTHNLKDGQNDFTADFTQLVDNSYVPSVVSSATTTSSNVVTVSLSEAVTSNGGDLSANLANLEGLFTLKVGDTTLTGSDYTLSSANNQTLTFTIDAESNYIEKDEIVQVVYDANASTTTHNLKDGQNDFTADFTQLVDNSYVPSVVSSATTTSSNVVTVSLSEAVTSNGGDLSANLANLEGLFTLKVGDTTLTGSDYTLSSANNQTLTFTIDAESNYIEKDEIVQVVYDANASTTTHNLKDGQNDFTADFTQLVDNSYVPSVVSSATTTSSNVVTVSLSEAVTSNGGDLSANLANLEGLFTLKVGDTTLTGSDYTLSSADNQTLTFTIDAESNYIEKDEIVQVVYDANASTTTHNLKDGQNDFTADFTQLVDNSYVPSVVSSATTTSSNVVTVSLSEAVTSNGGDLSANLANLEGLFTLKVGDTTLTGSDYTLSSADNQTLTFTIDAESNYIEKDEIVQVVYDANASTTTHNLKDGQNDFTADFTQLVDNGYVPSVVSSATTTSSNVVTVSLSEAVTSNGGDLSANLANLEGLFTLKVGDTTLTGSDYTLSSANNQTLTFTIDAESNYIEKDEIVQVVYDANASTTTHNLKDGQNDFTADFTQLVDNSYVPSVVSSATTTSSNVVTVSLSEAVTSNGGDLSANLANLEGLFTLKVGDTTLTGSDYTLSSANNQTLTFTIDAESNYIEKDEIVQVVYDANASTTTHNLKDGQNDFTADFTQLVDNSYVPSVVSSATTTSSNVVTVSLSEAVTSNGGDLSANLANLEGLFTLKVGDTTLTGSDYTLSSANNQTLTFTIDAESNYIEKDEIVQVVYDANASTTTHNLKDGQNDFTADFTQLVDNSYVPSVVSSATTTSSNVVTVSLSEAVTSNGGDLSANLANLEGLFTLKVGDTTLTGSDYTLSSANNQTLTFTIDAESNYIEKDEIVQVVYDANASTTTHNLKDGQNDFTADFTQLVDNSYVPSVVSRSATTQSASVVFVNFTENVSSNSSSLSTITDFSDLGALFTLKIGSQSLSYAGSGSGTFSLTKDGSLNNVLNFTINSAADYIQNVEELVQVVYNANASDVTHNLIDSSSDQTPDFVYTVPVALQLAPVGEINMSDILENSTLTFTASDILSSITDPNNDTLDASSITSLSIAATSNATVALDNSSLTGPVSDTWTFTPGDFYGEVKLSVTVSDQNSGGALSSTFETLFNVLSIDDAPIQSSSASLTSVARGQNKNISLTDLLGNITDKETTQLSQNLADNLSVVGNSVVADKGTVTFDASTSTWVYNSTSTNAANESITDSGTVTFLM